MFYEVFIDPIAHAMFGRAIALRQGSLLWALAIALQKEQPLSPIIDGFADDTYGPWRRKLHSFSDLLNSGISLPDALDASPRLLPARSCLAIRVGFESGALASAVRHEAVRFTAEQESVDSYPSRILIYLAMVAFVLVNITTFLMFFITPKFKAIFNGFGTELPQITITVIRASDFFADYWYLLIPLVFIAGWIAIASCGGRYGPFYSGPFGWLSRLSPRRDTPDILRSLAVAIGEQRPIGGLVAKLARCHPDAAARERLSEVNMALQRGHDCWRSLLEARLLKPGEAILLEAAQRVGNLPWALRETADAIERRRNYRIAVFLEFLRPATILCLGALIGITAVAFFLPVIKLINDLS